MKTCSILLVPVLFLSTALAWGREPPVKPSSPDDPVLPYENRRHDYKQSLKKPFQYNGEMPFWNHHGSNVFDFFFFCKTQVLTLMEQGQCLTQLFSSCLFFAGHRCIRGIGLYSLGAFCPASARFRLEIDP